MADALYLKVLEALSQDPASGGVDPREFGWPGIGPDPTEDFSVSPDYLQAAAQVQPPQPPPPPAQGLQGPAPFQPATPRRKIGLLQRPQQFVSELVAGGDPWGALLEGRATKETLGRQLFAGAQEKGFQGADLPAFAVDVLTDPLTYILPPLLGRSFKAIGSLCGKTTSVKFFADTIGDIMAKTGPRARAAGLKRMWKPLEQGGVSMTDEWFKQIAIKAGTQKAGEAVKRIKQYTPLELDKVLSYMQNLEYQVFQPSSGLFGQALNRAGMHLAPIASVLENQGGVWGQRMAKGIKETMQGTLENYGRVANDYLKFVDDLGLSNAASASIRSASTILAEAGGSAAKIDDIMRIVGQHGDVADDVMKVFSNPEAFGKAGQLADRNLEITSLYSNILGGFKDASGAGFSIQTDVGRIPFAEGIISNYMPHMFDWNELRVGKVGYEAFVRNFMKTKGIKSYSVAQDMIETMVRKSPKKFGNIEHARTMNTGGYKLDPLEYLPQWLYKTEYRLNFARQFGVEGGAVKQLVQGIRQGSRPDSKWVDDVASILLDRHPNQYGVNQIINKMTGFQVLTKMGFGSSVANASQSINTMAVFGMGNFMKGVASAYTDEGAKLGALAYNRATKEAIEEMMTGASGNTWAAKYLGAVGFNFVEKWNRFFAANTGVAALKNWGAQLQRVGLSSPEGQRIAARLTRTMGASQDDLVRLASGQQPWRELLDRSALLASENTQHATHWHQLPKLWQIPEARLALQYKNFAYNQARFMHQQILKPAMEYLGTRGRSGDLSPLLRVVPLFTTAGHAVSHLRDLMRIPIRGIATGDWDKREEWLWDQDDEWFSNALRDSLQVGTLGMVGDAFTAAERGKLPAYLLGPTVGDVADLTTRGIRLAKGTKDMDKSFDQFTTWMGRRIVPPAVSMIPGVGPTLAGVAQQYPYDVTYGDIDMDRFINQMREIANAGQR